MAAIDADTRPAREPRGPARHVVIRGWQRRGGVRELRCRVGSRVHAGGHFVPEDKIRERLNRLLANVRNAIPPCDCVMLFDNSDFEAPYRKVAEKRADGSWHLFSDRPRPPWAAELIG